MDITELDPVVFANFGKTPPYQETEVTSKSYPEDFLILHHAKSFLVVNKEKAWLVHADSLMAITEELENYLEMSETDFIMIALGKEWAERFCFNDNFEIWEKYITNLRTVYYSDHSLM